MNAYTIINIISNLTIAFSAGALLIHILGDPDNAIWNNRIKAYLAKLGLSITTCGAIINVLTLSTPNKTEILLNVGMSVTFFWLSWWQWEQFKLLKSSSTSEPVRAAALLRTENLKVEASVETKPVLAQTLSKTNKINLTKTSVAKIQNTKAVEKNIKTRKLKSVKQSNTI
jgi:hypothetical protein